MPAERITSFEGRRTLTTGYFITGQLIDTGLGVQVGTMRFRMNVVFANANTDQSIAHGLGRVPNGYREIRRSVAGVLYDATSGTTLWTPANITLRASVAGTYSFELL